MIEATTSILYAIRYLLNINDRPVGNISIDSMFVDEEKKTVKMGIPECQKIVHMKQLQFKDDFEALALVLKEIAECVRSEPIQMNLLAAAELCKTKTEVGDSEGRVIS